MTELATRRNNNETTASTRLPDERITVEIDLEALRNATSSVEQHREDGQRQQSSSAILRKNRAIMTVLHFVLTYPKFSVSLFLLFANLTTPLPTANEKVWQPVQNLRVGVVQIEAALYHECVRTGFAGQNLIMDRTVALEQERIHELRAVVLGQQLAHAANAASQCFNATLAAQRAMQAWDALGLTVPKTFRDSNNIDNETMTPTPSLSMLPSLCSADDQERLADMLSQDLTAVQNNVQSILDAYISASLASLHKLLLYSQDRGSYDYNYFIGVKVQAVLNLLDHFSVPNIFLTFPEQRLILELRGILQGLLDALHGAYLRVDLLSIRIAEFEASLQAFYLNYIDLYGRFELIGIFMRDFLPSGVALPDYFDISGVPLPSSLLPPIFAIPEFNGVLPNIEDLVSEYIIKAIQLITRLLQEAAEEASEQTRRVIEALIALLREILILEDYDPPKYPKSQGIETPEDELASLANLADQTKADASDALDELKKRRDNVPDFKPVTPDPNVDAPSLGEKDQTRFEFLNLSYPAIAIPVWILTVVGFIFSRTFLIECLTQAVRLYRLKQKYEKNATPDLPVIDYLDGTEHDEDGEEKDESKPSKMQAAQVMLLKHIFNPWVILGLMIIPIILAILIFWFPHVKRTCIDSRRGTFLARNVFKQVQVNQANSQGYALYTVAQTQCHLRQRTICSAKSTESDTAYRNDVATLFALQTSFNESNSIGGVIDRCVDTDVLDRLFGLHCCGLEGYSVVDCSKDQHWQFCPIDDRAAPTASFRPVGESLLDSACDINLNALNVKDALFNCSVLEETCNAVPCSGVDADLIEYMTIEADCSVEIYAIQVCIFIALAVYHAIMINLGNTLMFNGILQIRWKSLQPDGIKMITHVNLEGELVKGNDLQERTDRVDKVMKRYVLAGYIQIGLSLVVFVFWMTTFLILRSAAAHLDMYHA